MSNENYIGPLCIVEAIDMVDGINNPNEVVLGEATGAIRVVIQDPDTRERLHLCPDEGCKATYTIDPFERNGSKAISDIRESCARQCIKGAWDGAE